MVIIGSGIGFVTWQHQAITWIDAISIISDVQHIHLEPFSPKKLGLFITKNLLGYYIFYHISKGANVLMPPPVAPILNYVRYTIIVVHISYLCVQWKCLE